MSGELFVVEWYDDEDLTYRLFVGPKGCSRGEFKGLCDGLIRLAAEEALENKFVSEEWSHGPGDVKHPIGYGLLIDELAARLAYYEIMEVVGPATVVYKDGAWLVDPGRETNGVVVGDLLERVMRHNSRVVDEYQVRELPERDRGTSPA